MSELDFVQKSSEDVLREVIETLEQGCAEPLYPGDERRIFGEALAAVLVAFYSSVNDSCRQKFLRYARGEVLDALGETRGIMRLDAIPATTTLRFSLNAALAQDVTIPAGTRATSDFVRYFSTDTAAVIPAGSTYVDVPASATVGGADHNAIPAGSISVIVDLLAYVDNVSNRTATTGGADQETDDAFRERIRAAASIRTTAGTAAAYRYYAMQADASVVDAVVTTPSAGNVVITPVLENGGIPSQAVLDRVLAACTAPDVKPLTDNVTVAAPTQVTYNVNITYYTTVEDETRCVAAVEGLGGAIDRYKTWQSGALGRAINPDMLRKLILAPDGEEAVGATRVTVTSPAYAALDPDEVAVFGALTVTHVVEV